MRATAPRSTAPRWTQDDILLAAAETFSLLPRPSGAAIEAFVALLGEYWPSASAQTRGKVGALLRGSPRSSPRVIEMLDLVSAPVAKRAPKPSARNITIRSVTVGRADAEGEHRRQTLSPPPLNAMPPITDRTAQEDLATSMWADMDDQDRMTEDLSDAVEATWTSASNEAATPLPSADEEDAAAHARAMLRRVALTGERGPVIQPRSIAERLARVEDYVPALADLLHLSESEGRAVLTTVPGTLIALRSLGVPAGRAVRLTARWHGVEPAPLLPPYRGLRLTQCLDAVADWRNISARGDEVANEDKGTERTALSA